MERASVALMFGHPWDWCAWRRFDPYFGISRSEHVFTSHACVPLPSVASSGPASVQSPLSSASHMGSGNFAQDDMTRVVWWHANGTYVFFRYVDVFAVSLALLSDSLAGDHAPTGCDKRQFACPRVANACYLPHVSVKRVDGSRELGDTEEWPVRRVAESCL